MNSDDLILVQETHAPLTTKGAPMTIQELDENWIKVYNDLEALQVTTGVPAYDPSTTYNNNYTDSTTEHYATFNDRFFIWVNATPNSNVTPVSGSDWQEVPPTILAHEKNKDTKLAAGTVDEVSAADLAVLVNNSFQPQTIHDVSASSLLTDFVDFPTGTINVDPIDVGDEYKITAVFRNVSAPVTDGFGLYFFFDNAKYCHPKNSTPTYGNSFFKLPYNKDLIKIEITISKIDASNWYILCKSNTIDTSGFGPTNYLEQAWYSESVNWASITNLKVQAQVTATGEINMEYFRLEKN